MLLALLMVLCSTRSIAASGRPVLLSIGMSNTAQTFCGHTNDCENGEAYSLMGKINTPSLLLVNGAQGKQVTPNWLVANGPDWYMVHSRLAHKGATEADVKWIWLQEGDLLTNTNPAVLAGQLNQLVPLLHQKFPNLQEIMLSGVTCTHGLEPLGLNSWVSDSFVAGVLITPNWHDCTWPASMFGSDGVHLSNQGINRTSDILLAFIKTRPWFQVGGC